MIAGNKDAGGQHRAGCHSAMNLPPAPATVRERDGWHDDGRARMVERPATVWQYAGCNYAKDGYAQHDRACAGCAKLAAESAPEWLDETRIDQIGQNGNDGLHYDDPPA